MKPATYLVLFKDEREQPTRYFGPFPSPTVAEYFKAELPEPLETGCCRIVTIQPFTSNEGSVVNEKIRLERQSRPHPITS